VSALWLVATLSAGWVLFAYLGYPALLGLLARLAPRPVAKADVFPPLSVIIAVHDGGERLARKLEATLGLDYPAPVEVIVASDGSTDDTDRVARSFEGRGVLLVRSEKRAGKEAAQDLAIRHAKGEILVFTDLGAELEAGALRALVRPFADPSVGAVSSEDVVEPSGGEGAYVRYEMALRRLESETTSLIGLSGSCFAVRRVLAAPWPHDLASDFRTALEAGRRGLRAVAEASARARFSTVRDPGAEWARKVRTVQRGLAVLSDYRDLLHPRHGRVALSLWGHKVARFTSPFALLALLGASGLLAPESALAAVLLAVQVAGLGLGALSLAVPRLGAWLPARLAGFFLLVNASILVAWVRHLSGPRAVVWEPTRR
jgi:hypothetical protein